MGELTQPPVEYEEVLGTADTEPELGIRALHRTYKVSIPEAIIQDAKAELVSKQNAQGAKFTPGRESSPEDFEDSGKGSPVWDLAFLVQSANRFGLDHAWVETCLQSWQQASHKELPRETLTAYVDWKYWCGALSMIKRAQQEENPIPELQTRLKWVHNPTDKSKWTRC